MANVNETSSAYTVGPWSVEMGCCYVWVLDQDGNYIAEIVTNDEEGRCDASSAKANARLIAAAPELLEAGSTLVDELANYVNWKEERHPETTAAFDLWNKAVAKAEDQ